MTHRTTRRTAAAATLALGVLSSRLGAQAGIDDRPEPGDNPRLRYEYLMRKRAWPRGEVPVGALQAAKASYRAQWPGDLARRRSPVTAWQRERQPSVVVPGAASPFGSAQWTALGPAPIVEGITRDAGRIAAIAVHPVNRQTLYVGGAQGGVWKTTDGGASWTPLTDGECSLAMGALALDPVNPEIVYAGTGEMNFSGDSYYGCGMLRSTDGGATWSRLGASVWDSPNGGATISKIIVDRASAGGTTGTVLNVASSLGVWRSTDGGATWTRTLDGIASDLVADPTTDGQVLYTALGSPNAANANGVYRSADRGATWTRLATGLPSSNVGRIALAHGGASGTVVAAMQDAFGSGGSDGSLLGVWRTTDAGSSWTKLPAQGASCGTQCWYDIVVAVDPADANRIYFGGVMLHRSLDGGASFQFVGNSTVNGGTLVHVDHHAWAFDPADPRVVYSGNDGGIYRSTDGGSSWTSLNTNLELTQFYGGLSLHPTNLSRVLGGTQDNGTLEYRGTSAWPLVLGGDGGFTAIHPANPDTAWAETQWSSGGFSGPRRRTTAGGGFFQMLTGITMTERALFIPPLVMDRFRPSRLHFGTMRLYETVNGGLSWSAISPDLSKGTGVISAIATAATDARVVYVGTSDGNVRTTTDGGTSWATASGLPNRYVEDVVVDPGDARRAWVAFSGFGTGHVWRTTDGGATWSNVSGNLPDMPVNAIALVPGTGDLYAGTDLGIFVASGAATGGATWTPFNEGFPNVAVFALAYHDATGTLVAGSHGRGAFARALPNVTQLVAIAPALPASLIVGDTLSLDATARDASGAPATTTFSWTSSNPAVATVDDGGRVVARGIGATTIIARTAQGGFAAVAVTTRPIAIVASADSVRFTALTDTVRLGAAIVGRDGRPLADAAAEWRSVDPAIVSVEAATGLVRALANGTTLVIARAGGLSDTVPVRVRQVAVSANVFRMPDTLFAGERKNLILDARDARDQPIAGVPVTWSSDDPAVLAIDAAQGVLVAVAPGRAMLRAEVEGARAERTITVSAPSTLVVAAQSLQDAQPVASTQGTAVPLLRLRLHARGGESVWVAALGFDLTGRDRRARLELLADVDHDGQPDAAQRTVGITAPVTLTGGAERVRATDIGAIAAGDSLSLIARVVLDGGAPHGSDLRLAFVPGGTEANGIRSGRTDRTEQPFAVVEGSRRTTVLAPGEALSLSENPIRGDRVVMSFRETPRTAAIYTLTGRRVVDLARRLDAGVRVEWDLTNDRGSPVAPGVYLVIFDVGGQVVRQKLFVTRGGAAPEE